MLSVLAASMTLYPPIGAVAVYAAQLGTSGTIVSLSVLPSATTLEVLASGAGEVTAGANPMIGEMYRLADNLARNVTDPASSRLSAMADAALAAMDSDILSEEEWAEGLVRSAFARGMHAPD